MKKFTLRLSLFALPFVLALYPMDYFISNTLRKSNSFANWEYPVWNDIFNGNIKSEIIINGSSRAWKGVDAVMLGDAFNKKAYNIGLDGHDFYLENLRYNLLLEHNQKPELIIMILDNHTLAEATRIYTPEQLLPYMLWNSTMREPITKLKAYNYYDGIIPMIRYYGKRSSLKEFARLQIRKHPKNDINKIRGYHGFEMDWDPTEFQNLKNDLKKKHKKTFDTKLYKPTVQLFDKFLSESKSNNIEVVLVYAPEFIEGQKVMGNRKEIIDVYANFGRKYNFPFYDYSRDSISYDQSNFYNVLHLNKNGAEIFTKDLIKRLKHEKNLQSNFMYSK